MSRHYSRYCYAQVRTALAPAPARGRAGHLAEVLVEPAGVTKSDVVTGLQDVFSPRQPVHSLVDTQAMSIVDGSETEIGLELSREMRMREAEPRGDVAH